MALEVRRIVSGHDSQGKAVVATDERLAGTGAAGRAGCVGGTADALSIYFAVLPWRARSSPGGAYGRRPRQPAACAKCGRMSRSRESGQGCTGHRERE